MNDKDKTAADKKDINDKKEASVSGEEALNKKRQEYDILWDQHVRLCAEFDNSRKRWSKEREEVMKFANFHLLRELTVILDEMEQALKMARDHKGVEEIIRGIELTYNNFVGIFKKRGVIVIEAEEKQFDPHIHEIVASREIDDDALEHKVLQEVLKGYLLEGKVLRTSKVIVGVKKKPTEEQTKDEDPKSKDEGLRDEQECGEE